MGDEGNDVLVARGKIEECRRHTPDMSITPTSMQGSRATNGGGRTDSAVWTAAPTATEIPLKVLALRSVSANGSAMPTSIASEIELLKTENTFLRRALEEAQEKLRKAEAGIDGGSRTTTGAVRPVRREPGNGGVAYAQIRRLLLKDVRFLSDVFLAYLDIEDLGRCSAVCRRFKTAIYDAGIVIRCVETGGLTDRLRGLMWLIMVGMEPLGAPPSGLLSFVARHYPESTEEQYDRLHRAMNGTLTSPVKPSRTASGDGAIGGVNDHAFGHSPTRGDTCEGVTLKEGGGELQLAEGRLALFVSDNSDSAIDGDGEREGDAEGNGDSAGCDAVGLGLAGNGAPLWDGSAERKVVEGAVASPRREGVASTAGAGGGTVVTAGAGGEAAEATSSEALAKAAVEAADAAYAAEEAAGIRPLGRSSTATVERGPEPEDVEGARDGAVELADAAAAAVDAAADASAATIRVNGGSTDTALSSTGTNTTSVVGWASGLFRRSPSQVSTTAAGGSTGPSPPPSEKGALSLTPETSRHNRGESGGSLEATSPTFKSRRGLFGLRYGSSRARSELPAQSSPPAIAATSFSSFFGDPYGKQKRHPTPSRRNDSSGNGFGNGHSSSAQGADDGGDDDGWPAVQRVPGLYAALLNSADAMDANDITGVRGPKQSCFVDIEKDLKRTLGMKDVSPMRNVLRCMSTFVPDVGYVQGMNFVCRSLLQVYDDEEEAFWVFVGMLQRFGLRRLYSPGMPLLRLRFFQLNRLLMWHLPDLFEHFESCGVHTNLFATSWFVTLLSDGGILPDHEVKAVWDRIFLHATSPSSQWAPIFLLLLEMLRRASGALKEESRFSELIQRLVNMPFRELCKGRGASTMIAEAGRRFETSSPMSVQLLLLRDQWGEGEGEDGLAEGGDEKQLL